jgi:hypothetical protein
MKKEYSYLIIGALAGLLIGYIYSKNSIETTSSAAGKKQPSRRLFETWEHYKGRLLEWYKLNN